jgi:hypothetical protein
MEKRIGDAAGIVWRHLDQHSEATLSELRQGTKLSDQLVLLGLGWLAREGKVSLVQDKRTLKVSLRGR